ncbi:MAG: hypothetical protein HY855_19845 [Burkholderiales bacterium]|nr:hypothetical protein [Burkholderiales bacterium]
MQSTYPAEFTRDYGCTEAEWLGWLPGATRQATIERPAPGLARVPVAGGWLVLQWQVLPPRQIALMRMPRLQVRHQFEAVDEAARLAFMRYFDLFMQRGGG